MLLITIQSFSCSPDVEVFGGTSEEMMNVRTSEEMMNVR